jgi:protein-tyrosine-phosphatase
MAGAAMTALGDESWSVVTAGTFVVEGQPMSRRTFTALADHGLSSPTHRSRQAREWDLEEADLVVALAVEHVEWVRREHPAAAGKTATLARLVRDLPGRTVASLRLAEVELEPSWEDVADPGGGELPDFQRCAADVVGLVGRLHTALAATSP